MNIGIFGGKGFIGSHLSQNLKNAFVFQKNMRKLDEVEKFVKDLDIIYHVAGKNREPKYGDIMYNNLKCTGNLILACRHLKIDPYVIFISSRQVVTNPNSEYGITKKIEEKMIADNFSNWNILRLPGIFGPGARPNYNSVVATIAYSIVYGRPYFLRDRAVNVELVYIDNLIERLISFYPGENRIDDVRGNNYSLGEIEDHLLSGNLQGAFGSTLKYYRDLII